MYVKFDTMMIAVGLVIVACAIAYSCHQRSLCHERGGVMVYGGTCIPAESVIELP